MEDLNKITEANRRAWNQATCVHQQHRKVDLREQFAKPGYSTLDSLVTAKLREIGVAGKSVVQLGCNNGRELLSVLNLGAADGVGFDISDEAIAEAQGLAAIAGTAARFVRSDVYEIGAEWTGRFDLAFITIGALSWLPDLERFFGIVARLLRPGGELLIYEMHPFTYIFAAPDEPEYDANHVLQAAYSYFRTEPWTSTTGIDYVGGTKYDSSPCYSYTQKLSDIINPIAVNDLVLREFHEYPHDISELWAHLEPHRVVPLCYILRAIKPGSQGANPPA